MVNKKADEKANEEVVEKGGARANKKTDTGDAEKADTRVAEKTDIEVAEKAGTGIDNKTDSIKTDEKSGKAGIERADGQPEKSRPGRPWRTILFLTALVIIAASAAGYLVIDIEKGQSANVAGIQSLAAKLETLQQTTASLTEKNESFNTQLTRTNEQVADLLHNFSSLYQQRSSDVGWQLTEIKYLFLIASHRLALDRDVDTALVALQSADTKLREIADPALIPVREQLIADINRLRVAPRTDFTGLALLLSDLASQVEQFPLNLGRINAETAAPTEVNPARTENKWQQFGQTLWQELKTLVVVSRSDKNAAALLPQERYFLYQNLRLQLEAARLAVLIRDDGQFRTSVNACKDWLNDYFDTGDERVRAALASLEDTAEINFHGAVPSVSGSLRALEEYSTRQTRAMIGGRAQQ